jgi:hypothetical protein
MGWKEVESDKQECRRVGEMIFVLRIGLFHCCICIYIVTFNQSRSLNSLATSQIESIVLVIVYIYTSIPAYQPDIENTGIKDLPPEIHRTLDLTLGWSCFPLHPIIDIAQTKRVQDRSVNTRLFCAMCTL